MTDKKVKALSWDPVRCGDIYCAPACGGKCTWAAYQEAHKNAKALALMLGEGWAPDVWENLGWHYAAKTTDGLMKVHPSSHLGKILGYTAFFGEGSGGQYTGQDADPATAAALALRAAQKKMNEIDRLIATYKMTVQ